ncbi:MAG: hypothetical protein AAFV53_08680 [Myxococcota bacterium]
MSDPAETLDQAVITVREMGYSITGWMVQRDAQGFVAWLYVTDDEGRMLALMDEVEMFPTLQQAADWCLSVVQSHDEE